ncbi:MAG TPA: antibiotic biosynthesis monooxygenase [Rariglobus sp.]|nr:antibiotic biosynthesis monooxygenase [Rariglobus sp.]
MTNEPASVTAEEQGATVVITHRVREGGREGYEEWLDKIAPVCKAYPGHLDWHIVRPIRGLTATYTVVIRFDTREHLEAWMHSPDRKRLIEEVQPLLAKDDDFFIRSGLDFWFTPEGAKAKVPVRWKQFVVTWSAIYPLVMVVPLLVVPALRVAGLPEWRALTMLVATGTIVFLMTYVVMPRYTKLLKKWLFG